MKTQVVKFDPRNGFAEHITGESGCVNCEHEVFPVTIGERKGSWAHYRWHPASGNPNRPKIGDFRCNRAKNDYRVLDSTARSLGLEECSCSNPQPRKAQTIRAKPIEVGQKIALWEMWRGMKKGIYCTKCWLNTVTHVISEGSRFHVHAYGTNGVRCSESACIDNHREHGIGSFPRKLLETTIRKVVPIEMKLNWGGVNGLYICPNEKLMSKGIVIPYNTDQHPFIKADTPNWTNKQFIDFFLKTYPDIKKRWVKFWIWKW